MAERPGKSWRLVLVGGATLFLWLWGSGPAPAAKDFWPKRFEHPKGTVVMYQPQLEDLQDDKLTAVAAISGKTKEMKEPKFGAVWLSARVTTDRDSRMATIDEVKVTEAKFPEAEAERIEKLKDFLNTEMQDWSIPISLDRLLAALAVAEKRHRQDHDLKNDPPRIIFRNHPAVLVMLDGEPRLLPIPDSKLMQVANTPFFMLYDPGAKTYYLKGGDTWLAAAEVTGAWKDLESPPEPIKALVAKIETKKAEAATKAGKPKTPKEVEKKAGKLPEIIVSQVPAELLVTDGDPQYTPVPGTNLLFVSNTESAIFMDTGSQEYYVLLSGRWFKGKSLTDGPWSYVAPDKLPGDFAKVPPESTKGFVLVNVAGTTQAKEAVLENSIPQTAMVNRKKATAQVRYAGDPKFEKVAGTDLEYAVNTGTPVFKEGTRYYAVDQGVWYEADSANGPWKVCAKPPKEVDKIPPSNPHYNAKYVKVYDSTDDTVTVGYTPGYTGSYVDNGTVVYGTGYQYPSYATATAYIPYQSTYGYAAAYDPYQGTWGYQPSYYSPWSWLGPGLVGFGLGVVTGAVASNWWNRGWYGGGWWGNGGYHYNNININHNWIHNRPWRPGDRWPGGRPGQLPVYRPGDRPGAGWRPGDGLRPTQLPAHRSNIYNRPWNQANLAGKPGRPATLPAAGLKPGVPGTGPAAGIKPGTPGAKPGAKPGVRPDRPGQAATPRPTPKPQVRPAGGKNNVYADKTGNVVRRDAKGNWQPRQGDQWAKPQAAARPATPAAKPSTPRPTQLPATRPSFDANKLNQDFQARQRGQVRTQNYQRLQTAPTHRPAGGYGRPAGGGGGGGGGAGFRGGGGGRGGGGRR